MQIKTISDVSIKTKIEDIHLVYEAKTLGNVMAFFETPENLKFQEFDQEEDETEDYEIELSKSSVKPVNFELTIANAVVDLPFK